MIFRFFALGLLLLSEPVLSEPLTDDKSQAVAAVMAAEYALQNNDTKTAAIEYIKAAKLSKDGDLAEQATRLAMSENLNEIARAALAGWHALAPDAAEMWAMHLRHAMRLGEAESAFIFSKKLLSYGTAEYGNQLMDVLRSEKTDQGVMSRAVLRHISAGSAMPDNVQIWVQILFLAEALDEPLAAQALSEKIAAKFPEDPRALLIGASVLREKGEETAAIEMVRKASTLQPQNNWVKQSVLSEFSQLNAWLEAEKYLSSGPQDENTSLMRGRLIMEAGRQDLIENFLVSLQQQYKQPSQKMQLLLGQMTESLGRWSDAERWYRGVETGAERDRARLRLPVILNKQNRWNEALAQLRAMQKDESADGEFARDSYLVESDMWAKRGNDAQAMKALQRGLAIFENDPLLLYGRAMQHANKNRINQALADLKKIIDDNNQNAEALNAYGYTLAQHKQQYDQALPYVEKAMKLRPGSASTMDSLGWIKFMQRKYDEAQHWLEKAWHRSKDAEIAAHLGEVYWVRGLKDDARKVWSHGQAIDPDYSQWPLLRKKYSP